MLMQKCPGCGFHNTDDRERCLRCSARLTPDLPKGAGPGWLGPRMPFMGLIARLRKGLYFLGLKLGGRLPEGVSHRYPWTAAYLSILLGAGQFYNRQPLKALAFAALQVAGLAILGVTLFHPWNNLVLLGVFLWHLYMMADGFIIAARINGDRFRLRHVLAMWCAFLFFITATVFVVNYVGQVGVQLTWVTKDTLAPKIRKGDKVAVLQHAVMGRLQPGSVVYYKPTAFTIIRPKPSELMDDTYSVREQSTFGVVTALPGQRLSWEGGGPIMVDGVPVPPGLLPVNPLGYPASMDIVVPEDHYGILMTHPVEDMLTGSVPDPRTATERNMIVRDYDKAIIVPREDIYGVVLFRYQPPPTRRWFGYTGGLWEDYPEGYPAE